MRLDGETDDLTVSGGTWDEKCVEKEDGQNTALSYSGGSMKDCGTIGSGAWHVRGAPLYTRTGNNQGHTPSRAAVLNSSTHRCLRSIRLAGWTGKIHHRLDNGEVAKKMQAH